MAGIRSRSTGESDHATEMGGTVSTLPGDDAFRDAGLSGPDPDEPLNLAEAQELGSGDRGSVASEADLLDQAVVVRPAGDGDFPG